MLVRSSSGAIATITLPNVSVPIMISPLLHLERRNGDNFMGHSAELERRPQIWHYKILRSAAFLLPCWPCPSPAPLLLKAHPQVASKRLVLINRTAIAAILHIAQGIAQVHVHIGG